MTFSPSTLSHRHALLIVSLIGIATLTAIALFEVLGTVFLAITVAYVLSPAKRWLRRNGVGRILATLTVTIGAIIGIIAVLTPIILLLLVRLDEAIILLESLPESFEIVLGELALVITIEEVMIHAETWLRSSAIALSAQLPVVLVQFVLFAFVVFALVYNERDIAASVLSVVPANHRDIPEAFHRRARDTLMAIYVLQGATAAATVLVALPVFFFFGYESWIALAIFAGILQFVPVIGPSILIAGLVFAELVLGDPITAVMLLVVGGLAIAAFPDLVIRPQLARQTTSLSSTLYFIGFVGGILSIGPIGIILGPLFVALLVEATNLVSTEFAQPSALNAGG